MLNIRDPHVHDSARGWTSTTAYLTSVMSGPEEDAGQATRAEKREMEGKGLLAVVRETAKEESTDIEMDVRRQL
jgi:hypothetical protein